MLKKKIVSLTLSVVMLIGATSITAFAAPTAPATPEKPSISIGFDKEVKAAELAEKQANLEAKSAELAQKSIAFQEAKISMETQLSQSGKTQEEIDALIGKFSSKITDLIRAANAEVEARKELVELNVAARDEKGITKDIEIEGYII